MIVKLIPLLFLGVGVFLLVQVGLPIISYKLWEVKFINSESILASPQKGSNSSVLGVSIENSENFPVLISNLSRKLKPNFDHFFISIPSINLKTTVNVDSNDLSSGLIQLPGSALPGEKGNLFISGHSALPQFAKAGAQVFFAHLPEVKKGDSVRVTAEGVDYNYEVVGLKIVDPKDVSIIYPPDTQGRYISLMTCVPPGLNTKRLVVIGKII